LNDKVSLAVRKVKAQEQTGVCNIFDWRTSHTLEVIGSVAFGESSGMLELGMVRVHNALPFGPGLKKPADNFK
jgi:hypothetical protein